MKVLHVLPTLEVGGAERFLERLAPALAERGVEQRVVALSRDGPVGERLRQADIAAEVLSSAGLAAAFLRARAVVSDWRPDLVQTWLYAADLAGTFATWGRPGVRLVWNLRCSDAQLSLGTQAIRRACVSMARHAPDAVVACGNRAAEFHTGLGYPAEAISVIQNGYRFPPLTAVLEARAKSHAQRSEGGFLVGAAGRYDPAKGYPILLEAIARLRSGGHDVRLALAGRGCDGANGDLRMLIASHGLSGSVDLLGELPHLDLFFADLDAFCLSSVSEGFPNALCEAIAAGVPAVATAVGDAPEIMAPLATATPGSSEALADMLKRLLAQPRDAREAAAALAATRVRAAFDLDRIADEYQALYFSLLER